MTSTPQYRRSVDRFPALPGYLLGAGLVAFFDGIALHQILQWHNLFSAVVPPTTMDAMRTNMRADGWFHVGAWLLTALGVAALWRTVGGVAVPPPSRVFVGHLLIGGGVFNLVEGIIDHQLLAIHHVREVPNHLTYDLTFLAVGGVLLVVVGKVLAREPVVR